MTAIAEQALELNRAVDISHLSAIAEQTRGLEISRAIDFPKLAQLAELAQAAQNTVSPMMDIIRREEEMRARYTPPHLDALSKAEYISSVANSYLNEPYDCDEDSEQEDNDDG